MASNLQLIRKKATKVFRNVYMYVILHFRFPQSGLNFKIMLFISQTNELCFILFVQPVSDAS